MSKNKIQTVGLTTVRKDRDSLIKLFKNSLTSIPSDDTLRGVVYVCYYSAYFIHLKSCIRAAHKNTGIPWEIISK